MAEHQSYSGDHDLYAERKDLPAMLIKMPFDLFLSKQDRYFVEFSHPKKNSSVWTTSWKGPLKGTLSKAYPYYPPPPGWRRFSLKCPMSQRNYNTFDDTSIMYHGCHPANAQKIARNGFKPGECQHGYKAVYLTPSILYAAHPRYSKVTVVNGKYYQAVLECRVWDKLCKEGDTKPETLSVRNKYVIDPHYPDNQLLELLVASNNEFVKPEDGIVVSGVMVRCLGKDPFLYDRSSRWWECWPMNKKLTKKGQAEPLPTDTTVTTRTHAHQFYKELLYEYL